MYKDTKHIPVSLEEERMWIQSKMHGSNPGFHERGAAWIVGPLDIELAGSTIERMVQVHEILRTTYAERGGQPVPVIHRHMASPLRVVHSEARLSLALDIVSLDEARDEVSAPFDIEHGPLFRTCLVRFGPERHLLILTMHHLISDGDRSVSLFMKEFFFMYHAMIRDPGAVLESSSTSYREYAMWQRQHLVGTRIEKKLAWWRQELSGAPHALELPTDRPRPAMQTFAGAFVSRQLSAGSTDVLIAFAEQEGCEFFAVLLAGLQSVLHRYSGQSDVIVGTPLSGRDGRARDELSDLEHALGYFGNPVVIRARFQKVPSFRELLRQVQETLDSARSNGEVSFKDIVENLAQTRDLSRPPLFQVLFSLREEWPEPMVGEHVTLTMVDVELPFVAYELMVSARVREGALEWRVEYNRDLFDEHTIARLTGHLEVLLSAAISDPDRPVARLPLITEEERTLVLGAWDQGEYRPAPPACLHQLFEEQVRTQPDAVAAVSGARQLSYHQLNVRANRLAHSLRARGVGPGVPVALFVERSLDMLIGILGTLKAGGAYVPLDVEHPARRLAFMVEDVGAAIVITRGRLAERLPESDADILCLDAHESMDRSHPDTDPRPTMSSDHPAYIIYTSGSTGTPKGVLVSHQNVVCLVDSARAFFEFDSSDVWSLFHSYSFDVSVWEIWGALLHGGRLVVVPYLVSRSPDEYHELLCRERVTVTCQTPSAFYLLNRADADAPPERQLSLRYVILAGEAFDIARASTWLERHGDSEPRIINMYGITETTVYSTYRRVRSQDLERPWASMIGRPLPGSRIYLLDEHGQPVPIGVPGEIHVSGPGVTLGYHGRPDLTAARFLADPFSEESLQMYRSGDLGRFHSDGDIEYLGRLDHQVKLRGFRLELGEIESQLLRHEGIRAATVIVREDTPGDKYLAAYVVAGREATVSEEALLAHMRQNLPEYMVPATVVSLEAMPLNHSGKLDRRALPLPSRERARREREVVAPRTSMERDLCAMVSEVLAVDRVGVHDNFFALGGHSLRAIELMGRIEGRFRIRVPLRAFFKDPTVAGLADLLPDMLDRRPGEHSGSDEGDENMNEESDAARAAPERTAPASFAQRRLWFLHQVAGQRSVYNYPAFFRLRGPLDVPALRRALASLIQRHESLRTALVQEHGEIVQRIAAHVEIPLEVIDLSEMTSELSGRERELEVRARIDAEAQRPFDLSRSPLVRTSLLVLAPDEHVLCLNIHHVVTDGWSMGVLYRELSALYQDFVENRAASLSELPLQYADIVREQEQSWSDDAHDSSLEWWQEQLEGVPNVLDLPTDRACPPVQDFSGSTVPVCFPAALGQRVQRVAADLNATPTMVLFAAFAALLHRYTGRHDLLIGLPFANRGRPELAQVVGMLVNTLAVRCDISDDPRFCDLVTRIRATSLEAYEHADVPFERLVHALQPERDAGRNPLVQVVFAPQIEAHSRPKLSGLSVEVLPFEQGKSSFDLTLYVWFDGGEIIGTLEYSSALFERATIERMAEHLSVLVNSAVRDPNARISSLALLSEGERHQVLELFNDTATDMDDRCVHELVAAQAARTPDAVAVRHGDDAITYRELDRRANKLAHHLRRLGVHVESTVGILMPRCIDLVVSALAVLRAGGAYVPLEPDHPDARIHLALADADVVVVLTLAGLASRLSTCGKPIVRVDAERSDSLPENDRESDMPPESHAGPGNRAYIVFTSGSTGKPKGVQLEHRGLTNLSRWHVRAFAVTGRDRAPLLASPAFDGSVWETWPYLCAGACLDIPDDDTRYDADALVQWFLERGITISFVTTALGEQMLQRSWPRSTALRRFLIAGETLKFWPGDDLPFEVINCYGPTEITAIATATPLSGLGRSAHRAAEPPIGRPIHNTQAYILDSYGNPTPIGVPGELFVGGVGVGRGYLARPGLTAERFLENPFTDAADARMYRTGDRARWRADGTIEFLGRLDFQIKIRGFRVEAGEVECVLLGHPAVREVAVVPRELDARGLSLVAYVAFEDDAASVRELRDFMRRTLPEPMIPALFVSLASLPLNSNGKVDRAALPIPDEHNTLALGRDISGPREPLDGPVSQVASELIEIWREVLDIERVGMSDAFFDLGGHSLLLAQVRSQVHARLGVDVGMVAFFQHPTLAELACHVAERMATENISRHRAPDAPTLSSEDTLDLDGAANPPRVEPGPAEVRAAPAVSARTDDIAIVGMAGRFPGAADVSALWRLLCAGEEGVSRFTRPELERAGVHPELLAHPGFVPVTGVIDEPAHFDARFFGYSARDAELMDPQHRWFLSCAWLALEHAGYDPHRYPGSIGLFGGCYAPWYWLERLAASPPLRGSAEAYRIILGNSADFLVGRVAYKLGLRGPCINVQTACSTSLTAVHLARRSLLARECDMALAGASSLHATGPSGYVAEKGGGLSPDGHCRPFDARAQGMVLADAVALVVLKRLDDALADGDTIYAVLRGSAINNDGTRKIGYTAPSVEAQAEVMARAYEVAGVSPDTVGFVEAHGTGTVLGDPIEVAALTQAFGAGERRATDSGPACALGSMKSNIGHAGPTAGVAGLIKAALALHHETIPPTLHFERENPQLRLHESPFFVATEAIEWKRGRTPRRAAVNALGLGGTNVHLVLEEAPEPVPSSPARSWHLLVISAKSTTALEATSAAIAEHLAETSPGDTTALADIAATLQVGRAEFEHRRALVCRDAHEAAAALAGNATHGDTRQFIDGTVGQRPRVVFMFPGGGIQSVGMGADLYRHEPAYREAFDRCAALFEAESGHDIRSLLFADGDEHASLQSREQLMQPSFMFAAIACTEYALTRLLASWGITPDAVMGHSLGEYMAAHTAGVLSLPDAVALMELRARLHEQTPAGAGLVVHLSEQELRARLPEVLSIAAVNSPRHAVVSGEVAAIESFEARLRADGVRVWRLAVSGAPHSALIEPVMARLAERAASMAMSTPKIAMVSTVTGTWMTPTDALDPAYWARHLRQTVRFADGLRTICDQPGTILIEIGPGRTLTAMAGMQSGLDVRAALPTMGQTSGGDQADHAHADLRTLLHALGQLWCAGVAVDWSGVHRGESRRRVPVPSRPFDLTRYLVEGEARAPTHTEPLSLVPRAPERQPQTTHGSVVSELSEIWKKLLGVHEVRSSDDFFELGGSSLLAIQLCTRIEERLGAKIPVHELLTHSRFGQLCEAASAAVGGPSVDIEQEYESATPIALGQREASEERAGVESRVPLSVVPSTSLAIGRERLITRIQEGAPQRPPLFLVHPSGGTAYTYQELVRYLDEQQPVYASRASGLRSGEPIHDDIITMARCHVEELIDICPRGPYLLGGFSAGATVAFEVAWQLQKRGHEVALLCLIDAFTPAQARALGVHDANDWPSLVDEFKDRAPDEWRALRASFEHDREYREVTFASYRALANYLPRPLRCDVLFLRSEDRGETLERHPENWWMDFVLGRYTTVNTPGNHYTMLRPPHVAYLARVLDEHLKRAVRDTREPGAADESTIATKSATGRHVVIAPSGLRVESMDTEAVAQLLHLCGALERKGA